MSNGCFLWKATECSFYYRMCFLFLKIWMGRQNDKYRETWLMLWPSDHTHTNKPEDICIPHSWNYWVDVGDTHTVNTQHKNWTWIPCLVFQCHPSVTAVTLQRVNCVRKGDEMLWVCSRLPRSEFRTVHYMYRVILVVQRSVHMAWGGYEMFSFLIILQSTLWIPQNS